MRTSHARGDVGRAPLMSMPLEPLSTAARVVLYEGRVVLHTTQHVHVRRDSLHPVHVHTHERTQVKQ